jgi:hypothetical protein
MNAHARANPLGLDGFEFVEMTSRSGRYEGSARAARLHGRGAPPDA